MKLKRLKFLIAVAALTGVGLNANTCSATFVLFTSQAQFVSGATAVAPPVESVLFTGTGAVPGPATTITGVGTATGERVNLTTSLTGGAGQTIQGSSDTVTAVGGTLSTLRIDPFTPGAAVRAIGMILNPVGTTQGSITLSVHDINGATTNFSNINVGPGPSFLGIIGGPDVGSSRIEVADFLTISTSGSLALTSVSGIQIGGTVQPSVPEPASVVLLGIGLTSIAVMGVRRRRANTSVA